MTGRTIHAHPIRSSKSLGWFPALTLVMAVGLLGISLAFNAAREAQTWAPVGFSISMLVIFVLPAARILHPSAGRIERLLLVLSLGLALYWVTILRNPTHSNGYDEILNLRTLLDILRSGRLFAENPLLLVNPLYPGLASTTTAVAQVSGMDTFTAAIVVIGVMRVILLLGMFLLFESVSGSARVGAVGSLLYMTNPDFLFFTASYAYESFALPMAMVVLWLLVERQIQGPRTRAALTLVALLSLAAVVIGHHLTSIALTGALVVWVVTTAFRGWRGDALSLAQGVGGMAAIAAISAVTWSLYVASEMIRYLSDLLLATAAGALGFIAGTGPGRVLFETAIGAVPPEDRFLSLASTITIVVALPLGLLVLLRTMRTRPAALLLGVVALGYPASQALRLTSSGGLEFASRANSFVFVGVAFAIALLAVRAVGAAARLDRRRGVAWGVATSLVVLMFGGGIAVGTAWWSRLPGPFLVGGESRAISPEGEAVAAWMLAELGPGQRVAADRTNRLLLGSTGLQRVVFDARDPIQLLPLFLDPAMDPRGTSIVRGQRIRYVLVDRRLASSVPLVGLYFDQAELEHPWTAPIPAAALGKFDRDDRVDCVYDSGDLQLYDMRAILNE